MLNYIFAENSIPINGLSPVPRDQIGGNSVDLHHSMYTSFRSAPNASQVTPLPPPPQTPSQLNGKTFWYTAHYGVKRTETHFDLCLNFLLGQKVANKKSRGKYFK